MKNLIFGIFLMTSAATYGQYDPDRHNTSYNEGWISCDTDDSPNVTRGLSHWIMYDFGQTYSLSETRIWNSNVANNTNVGINRMIVDYSVDGVNWIEFGTFNVPQAEASNYYTGTEGPDLDGIEARYILITAASNYGGDCVGFSEIRFGTNGVVSNVVDVDELDGELRVYPNPMDQTGKIDLISIPNGNYFYQLTDLSGRVIIRQRYEVVQTRHTIEIDVSTLTNGIYTFTITGGNKLKSKTIEVINSK